MFYCNNSVCIWFLRKLNSVTNKTQGDHSDLHHNQNTQSTYSKKPQEKKKKKNRTKTQPIDLRRFNLYNNLFNSFNVGGTIITMKYLSHKVKFQRKRSYTFSLFIYIPLYHKLSSEIIFTLSSITKMEVNF